MWPWTTCLPVLSGLFRNVDTNQGDQFYCWEWIGLAQADFRVWELALAMFERSDRATAMVAPMVALYDELVGVDDALAAPAP